MSEQRPGGQPARGASPLFIGVYAIAYATLWLALLTPAMITLALRVRDLAPENATRTISWVLMIGALVALVSNPLFGALSDRTRSRFGRRRPWLLGGMLAGCAALALLGLATSVEAVLIGWCLAQVAYNASLAAIVALIPDRIPVFQRGTVVGVLGVCMPVGQIAGTYLVQMLSPDMFLALLVPGVIGVFGVAVLVWVMGEDPPLPKVAATVLRDPVVPADHRDFSWTWLSRVLFATGSGFVQGYQPFFLLDSLHIDAADIPKLIFRSTLVSAAMVMLWSLISGRLSDRTGMRKPYVMAGSIVQGVGLWIIAFSQSYGMLLLGVALLGMGNGIYNGVDLALVTDVLPDRAQHAAKDLGLLNIANTLPQVIAPLAAPALLDLSHGDYTLMFASAGVIAFLGSAALIPLRSVR